MAIERWFAKSNAANKAVPSDRAAFTKGDPVVMGQNLHGSFRLSLDRRGDERRRAFRSSGITSTYLRPAACLPRTVWLSSAPTFDRAAHRGSPSWASPDVPLMGRAPRRAETMPFGPLSAIRRIVAAIRLWRERARSRQQLRELSDRMLRDIGLRREEVGYQFPKPFWHRDRNY
jgi:uncharacterized protein YjiS (DUF1127 family)